MGTIGEKLDYLRETKEELKKSIVSLGEDVKETDTFRNYANIISNYNGVNYNVFTQESEPREKDGIWFEGANTTAKKILVKSNFLNMIKSYNWIQETELAELPYVYNMGFRCAKVGDYIYLFGTDADVAGIDQKYKKTACRYNYRNDTFEMLSSSPLSTERCAMAVIGTDIYLVGGGDDNAKSNKTIYKYDTLKDTYTLVGNLSNGYCFNGVESYGTDIYIFSDYVSGQRGNSYKFNTVNNSIAQIRQVPFEMKYGMTCGVGSDVYLFGGWASARSAYKYDILTNTYTQLANSPVDLGTGAVFNIDKYLFLFSGQQMCIYDIQKNEYSLAYNLGYDAPSASAIIPNEGNKIKVLFFGGTTIKSLEINLEDIENNTLVVFNENADKSTQLYNDANLSGKLPISFKDVALCTLDEGYLVNPKRYYGNGSEWIEIK